MASDEADLLAANAAFYEAFRARDLERLDALWAREREVAVLHPGWPLVEGRQAVLASWRRILEGPSPPAITWSDARAHLLGDAAFVICREHVDDGDLIATNVFVREAGAWRLVHHQAGPTQPLSRPETGGSVH